MKMEDRPAARFADWKPAKLIAESMCLTYQAGSILRMVETSTLLPEPHDADIRYAIMAAREKLEMAADMQDYANLGNPDDGPEEDGGDA